MTSPRIASASCATAACGAPTLVVMRFLPLNCGLLPSLSRGRGRAQERRRAVRGVAAGGSCRRQRLFPTRLFDNDSVAIERTARWEEPPPSPPARRCAGPAGRALGVGYWLRDRRSGRAG